MLISYHNPAHELDGSWETETSNISLWFPRTPEPEHVKQERQFLLEQNLERDGLIEPTIELFELDESTKDSTDPQTIIVNGLCHMPPVEECVQELSSLALMDVQLPAGLIAEQIHNLYGNFKLQSFGWLVQSVYLSSLLVRGPSSVEL